MYKIIPKAKFFPMKVYVLHHRDHESSFLLLHKHCLDLHQALLQEFSCIYSWVQYKTWCYDPQCVDPTLHLHSSNETTTWRNLSQISWLIEEKNHIYLHNKWVNMYLMTIYVTKNLFAMLLWEYQIKMSRNVNTKNLQLVFHPV